MLNYQIFRFGICFFSPGDFTQFQGHFKNNSVTAFCCSQSPVQNPGQTTCNIVISHYMKFPTIGWAMFLPL